MSVTSTNILSTTAVTIDSECLGERWEAVDRYELAKLIAIMALGQQEVAGHILTTLSPTGPAFSDGQLRDEAKIKLTVEEPAKKPRGGYPRWQRDGLIFEAISWLAAKQTTSDALLKAPHVSATTQGLDGLMLELSPAKDQVTRTTVFEDKCTDDAKNARSTFTGKVMPEFQKRHTNKRSAEMISAATTLIMTAGVDGVTATKMAAAITDKACRRYRASFAVIEDTEEDRKALFAGYNKLDDITQVQRIGACLVVPPKLRDWFDEIAQEARDYLDSLGRGT